MSEEPSLLKSPVPMAFQDGPGLGLTDPPPAKVFPPVHFPDRDLAAARVLPQDVVGKAVVGEIAGSDRFPGRPWIGAHRPAADQAVGVHVPDRGLAARILPENVGMAVVIEIAGSDLGPAR